MTVAELITELRSKRNGPERAKVTNLIHELERFSLGTEVRGEGSKVKLVDGKVVLS